MPATLIDGKILAENIQDSIANEIAKEGLTPGLAIILVGDDPASHLYVKLKEKACKKVGIDFHKYYMEKDSTQEHLNEVIDFLNNDEHVHAILIQLPLPDHLDEDAAVARIKKSKDVDGFGPENLEDFLNNQSALIPGLAHGIYELITSTGESLEQKKAVVLANSEIFAKPILHMLDIKGASAEYANPNDPDLNSQLQEADVVIVAIGKKWFVTPEMIKPGAIIIDVGTNNTEDGYFGDVDPDVDEIASYRSPVPGGVGPMTIAMLLRNTLELYKKQK